MTSAQHIFAPDEVATIIRVLTPGSSFVYFTGDLARERGEHLANGDVSPRARKVGALGWFMLRQGTMGEFSHGDSNVVIGHNNGNLTRRKIEGHVFEYIFTKTRKGVVNASQNQ